MMMNSEVIKSSANAHTHGVQSTLSNASSGKKMGTFMTRKPLRVIVLLLVCLCVRSTNSLNAPSHRIHCTDSAANSDCALQFGSGSVCHVSTVSAYRVGQIVKGSCTRRVANASLVAVQSSTECTCSTVVLSDRKNRSHLNRRATTVDSLSSNDTTDATTASSTESPATTVTTTTTTTMVPITTTTVDSTSTLAPSTTSEMDTTTDSIAINSEGSDRLESFEPMNMAAARVCATGAVQPIFLWVESPNLAQTDRPHYISYFASMRSFMAKNCVGVSVNRVIMKVPYPTYHVAYPTAQKIFWPPASSPLFTELIAKTPRNVKFHLYPMLSASTRGYWTSWAGTSDIGYAVFSFAFQWNKFLIANGFAGIGGVVVDYETLIPGDSFLTGTGINRLKAQFPGIQFGATIGFDDTVKLNAMKAYTDHFFLQMYDWYRPTQFITLTQNSPFIQSRNNAVSIVNYIMKTAIAPSIWHAYVAAGISKVHLMWSVQHTDTNCLNLQGTSNCGTRNDFGSWTPVGFNTFLVQIKASIAALGIAGLSQVDHGIFHYNSISPTWV